MRGVWAFIRGVAAALILAAIVAQFTVSVDLWSQDPTADVGFLIVGFWSFFTIEWVGYTLLRGAVAVDVRTGAGWYPYPFLNPVQPGGYGTVALYVVAIAVVIALVGLGAIAVSRWRSAGENAATANPAGASKRAAS